MIEIIVGVWLTSLLISIPITVLNVRYAYKLSKSAKYILVSQNLAKVGKYWSLSTENFKSVSEGSAAEDEKKAIRSYLYLGALGLLSALGLFFLIIMTVSLQFIARSRLSRRVFQSELAQDPQLSPERVAKLVVMMQTNSFE